MKATRCLWCGKVDTTNEDGVCGHCQAMAESPFSVLDGGWDGWGTEDDW